MASGHWIDGGWVGQGSKTLLGVRVTAGEMAGMQALASHLERIKVIGVDGVQASRGQASHCCCLVVSMPQVELDGPRPRTVGVQVVGYK